MPDGSTAVLWDDDSAGESAGRLEEALERLNIPPDKFRFQYALERLFQSVETMRAARAADGDSPLRLNGSLRFLINDEWVLTDWGLESVSTAVGFVQQFVTVNHDGSDLALGLSGYVGQIRHEGSFSHLKLVARNQGLRTHSHGA